MSASLTCWVISDGRRGIENQALGLANGLAQCSTIKDATLEISPHYISRSGWLAKLPPFLQRFLGRNTGLPDALPSIAIGAGRQSIAPLIDLKSKGVFTIYVQDPRIDPKNFDVVIAPQHDGLEGDNVLSIIGSPNLVTLERLAADKDMISPEGSNIAAFLIGGKSKTHSYSQTDLQSHAELIAALLESGWEVYLTVSRRTPLAALKYYSLFDDDFESFHFFRGRGENPYFAYLHHATMIFVTEDSTNMLTEACSTGTPVFRLPMSGNPGKFQKLYDSLERRCRVRNAIGSDLAPQDYEPLNETQRAAAFVWDKFHNSV